MGGKKRKKEEKKKEREVCTFLQGAGNIRPERKLILNLDWKGKGKGGEGGELTQSKVLIKWRKAPWQKGKKKKRAPFA